MFNLVYLLRWTSPFLVSWSRLSHLKVAVPRVCFKATTLYYAVLWMCNTWNEQGLPIPKQTFSRAFWVEAKSSHCMEDYLLFTVSFSAHYYVVFQITNTSMMHVPISLSIIQLLLLMTVKPFHALRIKWHWNPMLMGGLLFVLMNSLSSRVRF